MHVLTASQAPLLRAASPQPPAAPAGDTPKPSALDSFAAGATKGGNFANTTLGAWNGALTGGMVGGAIGLGGSALSTGIGVLTGSTHVGFGTLLHTMGTAGTGVVVGAAIGGVAGGVVANVAGKFVGGLGAKAAEKAGLNPEIGRAAGTIGAGVLLGTAMGLSVAGINGAAVALTCGLVSGGVAYLRS